MSGPADKTSADVRKETKTPAEPARTTTATDSNLPSSMLEEGSCKTWGRPSVVIAASQEEALAARHSSTRATSSRLASNQHHEEEQKKGQHVQMRDVNHEGQVVTVRPRAISISLLPPSLPLSFFA